MNELNLTTHVGTGTPLVSVETVSIKHTVNAISVNYDKGYSKFTWNRVEGLYNCQTEELMPEYADAEALIDNIATFGTQVLICAELFDVEFENVDMVQKVLNVVPTLEHNQICLCIVSTSNKSIPSPLQKLFVTIDVPLPSKDDFREFLKAQCEFHNLHYTEAVADACCGLSIEQGKNALARMLRDKRCCDMETILKTKADLYKDTGFLKLVNSVSADMIGGNENVIDYILKRKTAFEPGSKKPKMKAIFLTGIQGCGKSLLGKILGYYFDCPVLFADLGAMKGGLVGETEKNTRLCTKIIDASGRIIVVFDEAEKGLAGSTGESHDGGASAGQLGHLLTWTQERNSEAIVVFTSNNPTLLPAEMMRAGRWDGLFFFGYPNAQARREVLEIQKRKHGLEELIVTDELVEMTDKMTPAEIEQLVIDLWFVDDLNDLPTQKQAISDVPKLWWTKRPEIERVLEYGKNLRPASKADAVETKVQPKNLQRSIQFDNLDDLKAKISKDILK